MVARLHTAMLLLVAVVALSWNSRASVVQAQTASTCVDTGSSSSRLTLPLPTYDEYIDLTLEYTPHVLDSSNPPTGYTPTKVTATVLCGNSTSKGRCDSVTPGVFRSGMYLGNVTLRGRVNGDATGPHILYQSSQPVSTAAVYDHLVWEFEQSLDLQANELYAWGGTDFVLMAASTEAHGRELWRLDGLTSSASMVADVNPGSASSNPHDFFYYPHVDKVAFVALDSLSKARIFLTDGKSATVIPDTLVDATTWPSFALYSTFLFYAGSTGSVYLKEQVGLYKTDGSSLERISGLSRVARLHPAPNNLGLLFAALYNTENAAVYITDGTSPGTVEIGTFLGTMGSVSQNILGMVTLGDYVFFRAATATGYYELYRTDGTAGGTKDAALIYVETDVQVVPATGMGIFWNLNGDPYMLLPPYSSTATITNTPQFINTLGLSAVVGQYYYFYAYWPSNNDELGVFDTTDSTGSEIYLLNQNNAGSTPISQLYAVNSMPDGKPALLQVAGEAGATIATTYIYYQRLADGSSRIGDLPTRIHTFSTAQVSVAADAQGFVLLFVDSVPKLMQVDGSSFPITALSAAPTHGTAFTAYGFMFVQNARILATPATVTETTEVIISAGGGQSVQVEGLYRLWDTKFVTHLCRFVQPQHKFVVTTMTVDTTLTATTCPTPLWSSFGGFASLDVIAVEPAGGLPAPGTRAASAPSGSTLQPYATVLDDNSTAARVCSRELTTSSVAQLLTVLSTLVVDVQPVWWAHDPSITTGEEAFTVTVTGTGFRDGVAYACFLTSTDRSLQSNPVVPQRGGFACAFPERWYVEGPENSTAVLSIHEFVDQGVAPFGNAVTYAGTAVSPIITFAAFVEGFTPNSPRSVPATGNATPIEFDVVGFSVHDVVQCNFVGRTSGHAESSVTASATSSTVVRCEMPAWPVGAEVITASVTRNGEDVLSPSEVPLDITVTEVWLGLSPTTVYARGGSSMTVTGAGFQSDPTTDATYTLTFTHEAVGATVAAASVKASNTSHMEFTVPAWREGAIYPAVTSLQRTAGAIPNTPMPVPTTAPVVHFVASWYSVAPTSVVATGNQILTVTGYGLSTAYCAFSVQSEPDGGVAHVVKTPVVTAEDAEELRCTFAPEGWLYQSGQLLMSLHRADGSTICADTTSTEKCAIAALPFATTAVWWVENDAGQPTSQLTATARGGETLQIKAAGLHLATTATGTPVSYACRFRSTTSATQVTTAFEAATSHTTFTCLVPAWPEAATTTLLELVEKTGSDKTTLPLRYEAVTVTHQPYWDATSGPSSGPGAGGTTISIHGAGFGNAEVAQPRVYTCEFRFNANSAAATATVISANQLNCTTPVWTVPAAFAIISITVATAGGTPVPVVQLAPGGSSEPHDDLSFRYIPVYAGTDTDTGPGQGGTTIGVSAYGLRTDGSKYSCLFQNAEVSNSSSGAAAPPVASLPVLPLSSSYLRCITPEHAAACTVVLLRGGPAGAETDVAWGGAAQGQALPPAFVFTAQAHQVTPLTASTVGGLDLVITGEGFVPGDMYWCRLTIGSDIEMTPPAAAATVSQLACPMQQWLHPGGIASLEVIKVGTPVVNASAAATSCTVAQRQAANVVSGVLSISLESGTVRLANTLVYASVADTKVAVTLLRGGGLLGDIVVDVYATVSIPSKPLAATALAAATAEATLASTRTKIKSVTMVSQPGASSSSDSMTFTTKLEELRALLDGSVTGGLPADFRQYDTVFEVETTTPGARVEAPTSMRLIACGSGTVVDVEAANPSCTGCPPGTYTTNATFTERCIPCAPGTYTDRHRATSCTTCPVGASTFQPGATSVHVCQCNATSYRTRNDKCRLCDPEDPTTVCVEWSAQGQVLATGWWVDPSTVAGHSIVNGTDTPPLQCYQVAGGRSPCLGGSTIGKCREGHEGSLCAQCSFNYYRLANACKPCPSYAAVLVGVLVPVVLLGLILVLILMPLSDKTRFSKFALCVNLFQFVSMAGQEKVSWPPVLTNMFDFFSFANLNIELVSPDCLTSMSVKRRLWVFMAVPLIVIAGVWMIASAIRLWDWHATRRAAAESSAEARATSKKLRKIHRKSRVARMTRAGTGNGAGGSPGAATSPRSVELAMAPTGGSRGANAGAGGGDSSSSEDDPEGEFGSSDSSDEEERGGEVATVNPVLSPGSSSTSSRVQRSMKHMKEHNPEVAAAYAEFFARKRNPWAASMWRRAIRGTLITLFISYMAVSRELFASILCRNVGGRRLLSTDMRVDCDDPNGDYPSIIRLVIAGIVIYPVGTFLVFGFILWRIRARREFPWHRATLGVLYTTYLPGFYWWEMVMMVKRLLLTTVNGLIRPELVAFKFTFFVLIISLYIFSLGVFKPYRDRETGTISLFLNQTQFLVAFGGIVFFFTAESVDSSTRTMVTVLLLAVFAIVAIVLSVVTFLRCRRWCRYAAEAREKLKEERRRARREKGATNAGRQRRLRTMQAAGSGHAGGLHVPPVARRGHPAPSVPHARLQSPTL